MGQTTQQPSQRDDSQKMNQSSSARPSSTGFYNQGSQAASATYTQQYPSHQPSQLYVLIPWLKRLHNSLRRRTRTGRLVRTPLANLLHLFLKQAPTTGIRAHITSLNSRLPSRRQKIATELQVLIL